MQALEFFKRMLWIRLVEEEIAARYGKPGEEQEMRCPVHLSVGQEAAAVGVCATMRLTDKVYSTHRCHAHYLAKGGALVPMLAEIYGKATGCIGGRGGSMHLTAPEVGMVMSVPIVSSSIPLAVGSALADSIDGKDTVTATFFGDASMEEGVFHESANFARLRNLPVLFVCENNLYSVYTPLNERQPNRPLADMAKAHDMASITVDGNNVEAVAEATNQALEQARSGGGPTLLVLDTYRWLEHCGPNFDNHIGYRTEAEYLDWAEKDPLAATRRSLIEAGDLTDAAEQKIRSEFLEEIEKGFVEARSAPLPSPEDAAKFVYA